MTQFRFPSRLIYPRKNQFVHNRCMSFNGANLTDLYIRYVMEENNNMTNQERPSNTATENWNILINLLTGGKNMIDISEKGIDINLLGFSAGIGGLGEKNPESTNTGLKAQVSTPWGSTASAGIQGNVGSAGLGGGLWARAALTPEIAAKAGLGGNISAQRVSGGLIAGAKTPITGERVADLSGELSLENKATE